MTRTVHGGGASFVRRHIIVSGRVQGVGFRYATAREAERLGLGGWVRNTSDGKVEIVAEGAAAVVQELVDWCYSGPPGARVVAVQDDELPVDRRFVDFRILS